ncbi:MAG: Fic family protein [Mycoplasma sp.]
MKQFNYLILKNKQWDNEVINLISAIKNNQTKLSFFQNNFKNLEVIKQKIDIQSSVSSNTIEGIVTTLSRVKTIIDKDIQPVTKDEKAVLGYLEVRKTILDNYQDIKINTNHILQIHRDLFKYTDVSFKGKFKDSNNSIVKVENNKTKVIFTPLESFLVKDAIDQLTNQFNIIRNTKEVDDLLLIPIFIHDFLCIHPFNDGNGRMSRLLTDLLLYQAGYFIGQFISIDQRIEMTKDQYYLALEQSSDEWHENKNNNICFIKYFLRIIDACYCELINQWSSWMNSKNSGELINEVIKNSYQKITKKLIKDKLPNLSSSSIEKHLKKLVNEKKLIKVGNGKNTYYQKQV